MINEAEDEETLRNALEHFEFGFSNPMNVKQAEGMSTSTAPDVDGDSNSNMSNKEPNQKRVIENGLMFFRNNRKIKKFWSSDALKDSWKEYNSNIQNGSISALFLSLIIFTDQAEEFIERLNSKIKKKDSEEKKYKEKGNGKSGKEEARNERKRTAGFYKEQSSEEDSDEDSKPSRKKRQKVSAESDFDEESVEEEESEEMEGEDMDIDDEDSQWDSC